MTEGRASPAHRAVIAPVLVCSRWEDSAPRVTASMCLRVSCHLQNPTCRSWEEQFPDCFPRFWCIISTEWAGPLSWRTGGQLNHTTQDLFVDWRPSERRRGGDRFLNGPPWKIHTSLRLPCVFLFLHPE